MIKENSKEVDGCLMSFNDVSDAFKEVSRLLQRLFHRCFKEVLRVFLRVFKENLREVL